MAYFRQKNKIKILPGLEFDPTKLFDLVFILAIIFSLLIFGMKYFLKKEEWVKVTIKVVPEKWFWGDQPPPNWYALSVNKGDKEFNSMGKPIAEIIGVKRLDTGGTAKVLYIKARLRAVYQQRKQSYFFKDQPLELNSPVELNLNKVNVSGIVTQINDSPPLELEKYLKVKIVLYERYPWYADKIKEGDKYTSGGEVLAEVIKKEVDLSQKTVVILGELKRFGKDVILPVAKDPLKRDITLTLKIKVRKEGEKDWVFRTDQLVKVGNKLNIPLDNNVNLFDGYILSLGK